MDLMGEPVSTIRLPLGLLFLRTLEINPAGVPLWKYTLFKKIKAKFHGEQEYNLLLIQMESTVQYTMTLLEVEEFVVNTKIQSKKSYRLNIQNIYR